MGSSSHTTKSNNSQSDFKRGDIVWAKVRGYSWWPARIGDIIKESKDRKYRVDFIGDNTHQTVAYDKVAGFIDKYAEYSKTKQRNLLESIAQAKRQLNKYDTMMYEKEYGSIKEINEESKR